MRSPVEYSHRIEPSFSSKAKIDPPVVETNKVSTPAVPPATILLPELSRNLIDLLRKGATA